MRRLFIIHDHNPADFKREWLGLAREGAIDSCRGRRLDLDVLLCWLMM